MIASLDSYSLIFYDANNILPVLYETFLWNISIIWMLYTGSFGATLFKFLYAGVEQGTPPPLSDILFIKDIFYLNYVFLEKLILYDRQIFL